MRGGSSPPARTINQKDTIMLGFTPTYFILDDVDPIALRKRDALTKKAIYAAAYGSERLLQQAVDEEGCSPVFVALKVNIWDTL